MPEEHRQEVTTPSPAARPSAEIDRAVGTRVRTRRSALKISQERLAEMIGVSFQQLQKYEAGTNRIGASRLFDIAVALSVPIGHFFGEEEDETNGDDPETTHLATSLSDILEDETTFEIVRTFSSINDHHLRRQLVNMLEAFCEKIERDVARSKRTS